MTAATTFTARGGIVGWPTPPATLPMATTDTTPSVVSLSAPDAAIATPAVALSASPGLDPHQLLARPTSEPRPRFRLLRRVVRLITTLAMLVLVVTFTAVAAMPALDARAMIVLSGSMEPLVSAGDAAIIRDIPVEDLTVGDVITYHGIGQDKGLTTHRIIALVPIESGLHFQTQGDANATPDPNLAPASNVVGRYDGMIPHGGRALLLLSRPEAKLVLVAFPALLMLVGELRTLATALTTRLRDQGGPDRRRLALAGLTLVLAAAVGVTATAATMAVLTDAAAVGDNTFSTATTF